MKIFYYQIIKISILLYLLLPYSLQVKGNFTGNSLDLNFNRNSNTFQHVDNFHSLSDKLNVANYGYSTFQGYSFSKNGNNESDHLFGFNPSILKNNRSNKVLNFGSDNNANDSLSIRRYFLNFLYIPYHAGLELIRTDKQGLKRNMVVLGIFATTLTMDLKVRNFVQDNIYSGDNFATEFLYYVGIKEYFLPGFAALYGMSHLLRTSYFHNTMLLSFQSLIITQGFTELTKGTVRRLRPRHSPDDPFVREKGNQSFISGHASGIWSVMTIFAGRYPGINYGFYGLATAVALARVYEDAHWISDVFMGSVIGYGVGRLTLRLNQNPLNNNLSITPFYNSYGQGATVRLHF